MHSITIGVRRAEYDRRCIFLIVMDGATVIPGLKMHAACACVKVGQVGGQRVQMSVTLLVLLCYTQGFGTSVSNAAFIAFCITACSCSNLLLWRSLPLLRPGLLKHGMEINSQQPMAGSHQPGMHPAALPLPIHLCKV